MATFRVLNYLSLVIAAICFGSIPVFSYYLSLLGVPSLQQSFFRAIFSVAYLFISIGLLRSFRTLKIRRAHVPSFALYGLISIALSIIAYITAIAIGTPVVVAVSLTYLYPAITLILARLFLKEPLTRLRLIAVPLSVSGAIIVSLPLTFEAALIPPAGIVLSTANAIFAGCYVVYGRKWRSHEGYSSTTTTFWGYTFATLWIAPLIVIASIVIPDPRVAGFSLLLPPIAWLLLMGFALVGTTLPYTLVNVGVENVDASAASIILLIDPISAVIMGYFFMNQPVAFWQLIGAILILLATALIAIEPKSPSTPSSLDPLHQGLNVSNC